MQRAANRRGEFRRASGIAALASLAISACADPTQDRAVAALGGEVPGVPKGALHRPGQPCVTCHGDSGPGSPEFSVGGTVYALFRENTPAAGAVVRIEDITGRTYSVPTNAAGNFYVPLSAWAPTYPIQMKVTLGTVTKQMLTHVGRAGSCADCHLDPPSQTSPGHVYIATHPSGLPQPGAAP
jgi:hypothetical protein